MSLSHHQPAPLQPGAGFSSSAGAGCFSGENPPPTAEQDFLPFDDEFADACVRDESERLRADPALLDLTGVTSHRKFDEVEAERWRQGQQIAAKLASVGLAEQAESLHQCHSFQTVAQCGGCRKVVRFWNRCDIFYCPQCSPRLSKMRLDGLMWWVETLRRPKHLVLTFRNVPVLTREYVQSCKKALGKFRRLKLMRPVTGGLWAMEITNEGKGWHLHFHLVCEMPFIPVQDISAAWKRCTDCESFIVHIEDATKGGMRANLPRYVTKYCGKGFRPHDWDAEQLGQFVRAVEGGRTFGVFGSLLGARAEWRAWLETFRQSRRVCECGCSEKRYFSEAEWQWKEHFTGYQGTAKPRAPGICCQIPINLPASCRVWPD